MARYKKDYKLEEAIKLINELENNHDNELIRYYVDHLKDHVYKQHSTIGKYEEFFKQLNRFLPKQNILR